MCYINEPLAEFTGETIDVEELLERLPECSECEKPIQDVFCYVINGEVICESCMEQYKQCTAFLMG